MKRIRQAVRTFGQHYVRFIEKRGLGLVITVCVAVIIGTAVWTNHRMPSVPVPPEIPLDETLSAADLMQQTLQDAMNEATPPADAPVTYHPPLKTLSVLTPFDGARLHPSGVSGVWRLHDAVDLAADAGEIVTSMADGTVQDTGEESFLGAYVTIDHGNGVTATYGGLAGLAGLHQGDPVRCGQTIGFAGNTVADEADLPPHLHLSVSRDGRTFDPMTLFDP